MSFDEDETTEAFIARVRARCDVQANGCWLWTGYVHDSGYGQIGIDGKVRYVHRAVYEALHGELSSDQFVCHKCDIRRCANPGHLFAGTQQINMADCIQKGRFNAGAAERAKTHCPSGHPYDNENTIRSGGKRVCRLCNKAKAKKWRASQGAPHV